MDLIKYLSTIIIDTIYNTYSRDTSIPNTNANHGNVNYKLIDEIHLENNTLIFKIQDNKNFEKHKYSMVFQKERLEKLLGNKIYKGIKGYYQFKVNEIKVGYANITYTVIIPFIFYAEIQTYFELLPVELMYIIMSKYNSKNSYNGRLKLEYVNFITEVNENLKNEQLIWLNLLNKEYPELYKRLFVSKYIKENIYPYYELYIKFKELDNVYLFTQKDPFSNINISIVRRSITEKLDSETISILKDLGYNIRIY